MDWNWFYSAVAQSSAAIVGIVGAFTISKIISNQAAYQRRELKLAELMTTSRRLKERTKIRRLDWLARTKLEEEIERLRREKLSCLSVEEYGTPEDYFTEGDYSKMSSEEEILERISEALQAEKQQHHGPFVASATATMLKENRAVRLEEESEKIDELLVSVSSHMQEVKRFIREAKRAPERSRIITWILFACAALFGVGVIYPLSFLPVPAGQHTNLSLTAFLDILLSLKGVILFAVSLIFCGVIVLLLISNSRMVIPRRDIEELGRYLSLGIYHERFEIMESRGYFDERSVD